MDAPIESNIIIDDLETLRVVSDPLRLKILLTAIDINKSGALCSVKQISEMLRIPPARLYYHIKLLETHNLLQVADTRIVSGILEKLYRVRSYRIMVSQDLFAKEGVQETIFPMFSGMIREVQEDLQKLLSRPPGEFAQNNIALSRIYLRLPKDKITEFSQKLEQLLKDIAQTQTQNPNEEIGLFTIFYAMYPEVKR